MKTTIDKKDLEALAILQEEAAEVIQAVSKIIRFGIDSSWNGKTTRQDLEQELGDLWAMITILVQRGVIREFKLKEAEVAKMEKLHRWSSLFDEDKTADSQMVRFSDEGARAFIDSLRDMSFEEARRFLRAAGVEESLPKE